MDSVIQILLGFVLFTLVENVIVAMFYEKCCGCKKLKWWQILVMAVGYGLIAIGLPPLIYQAVIILWMGLCLCLFNKKFDKKYFIYCFVYMALLLVVEMIYSFLLEVSFNLMLNEVLNQYIRFLYLIPCKILEITIIWKGDFSIIKAWAGRISK